MKRLVIGAGLGLIILFFVAFYLFSVNLQKIPQIPLNTDVEQTGLGPPGPPQKAPGHTIDGKKGPKGRPHVDEGVKRLPLSGRKLRRGVSLYGKVLSAGGREPIAGAKIGLTVDSPNIPMMVWRGMCPVDGFTSLAVKTDDSGKFEFNGLLDGAKARLVINADGFIKKELGPIWLTRRRINIGNIYLDREPSVQVVVRKEEGGPIRGATVLYLPMPEKDKLGNGKSLVYIWKGHITDGRGICELPVESMPGKIIAFAPGRAFCEKNLRSFPEKPIILNLMPGYDLYVEVYGPTGNPLSRVGASFDMEGKMRWVPDAVTGKDGLAWLGGYPPGTKGKVLTGSGYVQGKAKRVVLDGTKYLVFHLWRGVCPRVLVRLRWPGDCSPSWVTLMLKEQGSGKFGIPVRVVKGTEKVLLKGAVDGFNQIMLFCPEVGLQVGPTMRLDLERVGHLALDVPSVKGVRTVNGKVIGPDGQPVNGAMVTIAHRKSDVPWAGALRVSQRYKRFIITAATWSDGHGDFNLPVYSLGPAILSASHPKMGIAVIPFQPAVPVLQSHLDLRLRNDCGVSGIVSDSSAKVVLLENERNTICLAAPIKNGRFQFSSLSPGHWRLRLEEDLSAYEAFSRIMTILKSKTIPDGLRGVPINLNPGQHLKVGFHGHGLRLLGRLKVRVVGFPPGKQGNLILTVLDTKLQPFWGFTRSKKKEVPRSRIVWFYNLPGGRYKVIVKGKNGAILGSRIVFISKGENKNITVYANR